MIQYGKAAVSDFLSIARLDREAWKFNRDSEFIPDGEHVWRIWVEHALIFVAKEGDAVIGAILAFPCISEKWCVHKVFVHPNNRGRGIGTNLFAAILEETDRRGADCFLTVDTNNQYAIRLYERWGFTQRVFVAGYYRPNEDRLVLTRVPHS